MGKKEAVTFFWRGRHHTQGKATQKGELHGEGRTQVKLIRMGGGGG